MRWLRYATLFFTCVQYWFLEQSGLGELGVNTILGPV
jgi:hypothetical protein